MKKRQPYPAGRILRGALLGCGHISTYHLRAWEQIEGVKIVALANRTRSRAEERAREFGIGLEHVYSDYHEVLDREELDFVDIATAPDIHRMQVEDAAARGLHIFCQKPFAPSLEDAQAMITACDQTGVLFAINDNWRWRSWYREIKRLVEQGAVGRPRYLRIVRHNSGALPLPDGSNPPMFANQTYMLAMDRLIVYEWGIHLIDVVRYLVGNVESIYARMSHTSKVGAGEDRALMTLVAGGVDCLIDISWASIGVKKSISQLEQVTLEGETGSIELLPDEGDLLRVSSLQGTREQQAFDCTPQEAYQASYTAAQRHFAECLQNGSVPETVASDNINTLKVAFDAYASAAQGQVVRIEE
jgi:predicted dehydrogenase